jgi:endonuclease/exonuclease/phosphatase family metal-dependent hydrolase
MAYRALAFVTTGLLVAAAAITPGCRHPDPASVAVSSVTASTVEPAAAAPGEPLRVVTYNIHHIDGARLGKALAADKDLAGADVIFLQEVIQPRDGDSSACALARDEGWHCAYAPGHGLKGGSLGVAILSRRPLGDLEAIELPFYDVRFNAGRRVALAATIDVDGTAVRVFSVHLDNRLTASQRVRQLEPVMEAAARWDGPAIVAGDMNTSPFTWVGHVVPVPAGTHDDKLERFVRSRGFTTPVSKSGPTHQYLSMRLDHIFTRGLGVSAYEVEHRVRESDHLPLWADLSLPRARVSAAAE